MATLLATLSVCVVGQGRSAATETTSATGMVTQERFWDLRGSNQLLEISITIGRDALESLRNQPRAWVSAAVQEGGKVYTNVAVHLKGHGTFRSIDGKASLSLKFNHFVKHQSFRGSDKINFNACPNEKTYLKEYIAYNMFRTAGIAAPNVCHAKVMLNGKPLGLYVVREGITKEFLGRFFTDPSGNLYEGEMRDVSESLDQDSGYDVKQADVKELVSAAESALETQELDPLKEVIHLESFLRYMAAEVIMARFDGYCLRTNNYRIYREPGPGKFSFVAHGADSILSNPYETVLPEMKGLIARAVMASEEGRQRYLNVVASLYGKLLDHDGITMNVTALSERLEPILRQTDSQLADAHKNRVTLFLRSVRERRQVIQEELMRLNRQGTFHPDSGKVCEQISKQDDASNEFKKKTPTE